MAIKRDVTARRRSGLDLMRTPPQVLNTVITLLERPDTRSHRLALWNVLTHGPFYCSPAILAAVAKGPAPPVDRIATELLAHVRRAVRSDITKLTRLKLTGVQVETFRAEAEAASFVYGPLPGIAALGFVTLLHVVGLPDIRPCAASDCEHLFVKIHKRKFCSERCEKRVSKRRTREGERQAAAADVQTKWRRRVTAQGKK